MNSQILKKTKSLIFNKLSLLFLLLMVFLSFLLISMFHQYEKLTLSNVTEPLTLLTQNASISLKNEILQSAQGLQFFVDTIDFNNALNEYRNERKGWNLNRLTLSYSVFYSQVLENLIIKDGPEGNVIWKLKQNEYTKIGEISGDRIYQYSLWHKTTNPSRTYISITVQNATGEYITEFLDLQLIFNRNLLPIESGKNVSFTVLNQDKLVLMDRNSENIGINKLDHLKEQYKYKDLNFHDEEELWREIENNHSGDMVIHSYWWDTLPLKNATKIVAYHKIIVDKGFFVFEVTKDYSAVAKQLAYGSARLFLACLLLLFVLSFSFFSIYRNKLKEAAIIKENKYLNEINKTLQSLHDNEKAMFHQQRLQIIGTMTNGINHELNNMLTPILGYSSLMEDEMKKDAEGEKSKYMDEVHEILLASMKARDIIQQISYLGKQNIETIYHYQNAYSLLIGAKKMMTNLIPSNIILTFSILDKDSGFYCNTTQINQVLLNIVLNAIASIDSNKRGTIEIIYTKSFRDNLSYGCISIIDNGCGMDTHVKEQIFTPFFTTKKASDGSGLGLAIASQIISSHKGLIKVDSKVSKGTTFTILLPLAKDTKDSKIKKQLNTKGLISSMTTILLVDENAKVRKVLEKGLRHFGMNVLTACDLKTAIDLFRVNNVSAIVCGDPIGKDSGINLSVMTRQIAPTCPSIILTAFLRKEVIEAKQTGLISTYLVKPVTFDELIEVILENLRKSKNETLKSTEIHK
ncbi:MAG: response regulator [Spirochaetaceae bacterium]|nr:response regulator [Spirochaetaceae bacterium]